MENNIQIEGYMSRKAIRKYLEHYNDIKRGDYSWKETTSTGPKVYDGISGGQLNRIMIDQAIEKLPKIVQACCRARWIHDLPAKETTKLLKISRGMYNHHCAAAIELIHEHINGSTIGAMKLLQAIKDE
ncbi:hypothetical protein [Lentibacillus saliphilus]|uniref:hypothetical protein n=1 Tax=Lentibacillus saliphilus TaxID=2737028 RepID=UPI001C2FE2C1|nr:hypothetical protein [Lentibacillus saliphilus]